MPLKLPPKLQSPFTLAEWLDLDIDNKDPKIAKSLKELNLALINLKRVKPPMASDFQRFTEETAFLLPRFKKMLGNNKISPLIMEDFVEPFYDLLKKWQKGALKIQDILEDDEGVGQDAKNLIMDSLHDVQLCKEKLTKIATEIDKQLKHVNQLAALANKKPLPPVVQAAIGKLPHPDETLRTWGTELRKCEAVQKKLLSRELIQTSRDFAKKFNDTAHIKACADYLSALDIIEKLDKAIEPNLDKYDEVLTSLKEKLHGGLRIRR